MASHERPATLLATEIQKRLSQLGMSRRELIRRINISRQTLANVEHGAYENFTDHTFSEIDKGLKWEPGTAKAFHQGNQQARDVISPEERIENYLTQILARLAEMNVDELEREVLMLEEESVGRLAARNLQPSKAIDMHIKQLVSLLLRESNREHHRDVVG